MRPRINIDMVTTYEEAFAVALIRNECRHFMTNDTSELNVERQIAFFEKLQTNMNPLLFIMRVNSVPCGYGLVQIKGKRACLTGGLATTFRSKGLGHKLFWALITAACDRGYKPWLTVLRSNERALRLYTKLGFHITDATKDIYTMDYRP